jgi:isopenicillin-N epimerase
VLAFQRELQARIEAEPVRFFTRTFEPLWDEARATVAQHVDCDADDLVSVPNATTGVNTVLRSLELAPGDELVITDQTYGAVRNAVGVVAKAHGARVITARVPFPVSSSAALIDAILGVVTDRARCVILDHITSPTALIMPVEELVYALRARGVCVLVDGAHAPGMLDVRLRGLRPDFYTGNCHKWMCAPKGAGFLYVDRGWQDRIHPLVISHGARAKRPGRSRFLLEFGWTGTHDPTAFLSVPAALRCVGGLCPGGWPEVRARNHALAVEARRILLDALGADSPCPEELLGSMASVMLPDALQEAPADDAQADTLQSELLDRHGVQVSVIAWPRHPRRLLRISAQLYNERWQYERLAELLVSATSTRTVR